MFKESEDNSDGYSRVIKYLGVFGGAQGLSMLLNVVRNKIASVLLGVSGLSIIALFNRTIQMFSDCTGLSMSLSAVRGISEAHESGNDEKMLHNIKVVRSVSLFSGFAGMLLMLLITPFISGWVLGESSYYLERLLMLSPVVLFMAVTNGEMAVLRGTKQLSRIALYTVVSAVMALCVSVALYMTMGLAGIFPSLFSVSFLQMCTMLYFSLRSYSYKASPLSVNVLKEGVDIVKLGAGYIFASMLTSCALWLIYSLLSYIGDGETAGLFNAGFVIMTLLPGVLFAALDSEYYPRLSGVASNVEVRNTIINEQIEVQLLVQSPLLVAFVVAMPVIIPLFYESSFAAAVPMAQIAMFGMFMRTMTYPISFLPVSKNDTMTFVLLESVYNILLVALVVSGYSIAGFIGVGAGIALTHLLDFVVVALVARYKYKMCLSGNAVRYFVLQLPLFIVSVLLSFFSSSQNLYWLAGIVMVLLSLSITIYVLARRTLLFNRVIRFFNKIQKRLRR